MKKAGKRFFSKSGYRTLKAMVIDQCGDKTAEEIWSSARNELNALLEKYRDIPKGEKMHLCGNILPRIAMYRAMLEKMPQEDAVHLLDETIWLNCTEISKKLGTLTSLPGMPSLFLRIFAFMTKKMFGEANGFQRVFHEATGKSLRIDITQCPYFNYSKACGCEAIAHTFCDSDDYCYGNLPKIEFIRSETLGRGGSRCDFCLRQRRTID